MPLIEKPVIGLSLLLHCEKNMIAVCNKCGKMFETTYEDACTPGVLCVECWNISKNPQELAKLESEDTQKQQNHTSVCQRQETKNTEPD